MSRISIARVWAKLFVMAGTMLLIIASPHALSQTATGKVSVLLTPTGGSDCAWLTLEGISVADPVNNPSGGPWFALPRTHGSYQSLFAMLLATRLSGVTITIATAAQTTCAGYIGIANVRF